MYLDGAKIKELRSRRFTVEEFAVKIGSSGRTVTRIEASESTTLGTARRVAKALGVKLDAIRLEGV